MLTDSARSVLLTVLGLAVACQSSPIETEPAEATTANTADPSSSSTMVDSSGVDSSGSVGSTNPDADSGSTASTAMPTSTTAGGEDSSGSGTTTGADLDPPSPGWPELCPGDPYGVSMVQFQGPVSRTSISFQIYLPPGYDCSDTRYPVSLILHGVGGSSGMINNFVPSFEQAMMDGRIGPMILVAPTGWDSMWADSINGDKPAETNLVEELLPHVEETYRTLPGRRFRIVQGFSMGGHGTALYMTKFPELFVTGVAWDGAFHTWSSLVSGQPDIANGVFGGSEAHFDEFSPWTWAVTNADALDGSALWIRAGALTSMNRAYRDHIADVGFAPDYAESPCGHDIGCLLDHEAGASWQFIYDRMAN